VVVIGVSLTFAAIFATCAIAIIQSGMHGFLFLLPKEALDGDPYFAIHLSNKSIPADR
jgi:hypothetical protein